MEGKILVSDSEEKRFGFFASNSNELHFFFFFLFF